jgi:methylenetetrahydrofolate reductase (NADPH)
MQINTKKYWEKKNGQKFRRRDVASLDIPVSFLLNQGRPLLSLEFFPPKTPEHAEELLKSAGIISTHLRPDFVSITDGAGGSTRELTYLYSQLLKERFGWTLVPHLTCLGRTRDELLAIAESYLRLGIRNVMCLRGDAPKSKLRDKTNTLQAPAPTLAELPHAADLVALLKKEFSDLCVGVAGYPEKHPEASTLEEDILHLKEKVDRGATWITTQMFFNPEVYGSFVRKCRQSGISQAIIPGLLPVQSLGQTKRFCAMSAADMPRELTEHLQKTPEERQWETGVEWTLKTIGRLREQKVPGIHLYILNKSKSLLKIALQMSEKDSFGLKA